MSSIDVSVNVTDASFKTPWGIAFDNSGNYYISNFLTDSSNNSFISKMSSSNEFTLDWCYVTTVGEQLTGLAYHDGYLYCCGFQNEYIYKIDINYPTNVITITTQLEIRPYGLAINNNFLYISFNSNIIKKKNISINVSVITDFYTNLSASFVYALTVDNSDNLYSLYGDSSSNTLFVNKINTSGSTGTLDLSFNTSIPIGDSYGLAWFATSDVSNCLFISNNNNRNISQYDADNGNLITSNYINTDASYNPYGIAFNNNYLYFVNQSAGINSLANTVYKGVEPSCYNYDTKILCLNNLLEEEYIPIQNLKSGYLIKTYLHGYRKIDLIGKISFSNNPNMFNCMYKMEKTDENSIIEDLIVTGGHSILVDDFSDSENEKLNKHILNDYKDKIDDKYLLLASISDQFVKLTCHDIFTCYHFTLESEDENQRFGIWANGILSETTSKNYFKTQSYTLL